MKYLRFNFCHPINGHANLIQLFGNDPQVLHFVINSNDTNLVEISVDDCGDGKWKAVLEWDRDGESFMYQKEFEIKGHKNFYSTDI
ncbi:hypothetical protein ACFQ3S_07465 [Mucilaginibacter terrae]|uniref:hypothetical protein n=1 Tax=Mucilaginibacter terrae TaxID=1955052 RepID=UPI003637B50A